jgi:DNA-binding MarR family transcriptional regulator
MTDMMPFGLKIAIINRAFRKKMDEKASAMGLTSVQLRVLGSVSRLEAAGETEIHQNDLERIEHVTHPAMTKLLQRLESKGFIQCVPSAKDRRYKKITCTEKSIGIHKMILAQDEEVLSELCKNFTEEQKKTLLQMTDMILKNIDSEIFFQQKD